MKVAVTSSGPGPEAGVAMRFGRCPYFVVVDTETNEWADVSNTIAESASGAGVGAATMLAKAGVGAVLTGNVGPNAAETLRQLGVKMYQAPAGTVRNAVGQFVAGSCPEITSATAAMGAGMGRGGGGGMGRRGGGRGPGRGGRRGW